MDLLRKTAFAAVIADMKMPRLSGSELVPALRRLRPGLPVIVITGHCVSDEMADVAAAGATVTLCKPFGAGTLLAALRRIPLIGDDAPR